MVKLSKKGLLGITVLLSLVTSVMVYSYLKKAGTEPTLQEGTTVVVAKADILPKTTITAEMVKEVKVPAQYMQPGAITSLKSVVGVAVREKIVSGEQITERGLVLPGNPTGFSGIIPHDKRAVTIAVTEVTGVAGFVKPGDYVDVLATFDANTVGDNVSGMLLQNVLVLAANHETEAAVNQGAKAAVKDAKDAVKTMTVTLAVSPDEAARLALSEDKGKVRLALRPYMPTNDYALTQVVTPADLVGLHGSPKTPAVGESQVGKAPETLPAAKPEPAAKPAPERGILVIRGTKAENVPIN